MKKIMEKRDNCIFNPAEIICPHNNNSLAACYLRNCKDLKI